MARIVIVEDNRRSHSPTTPDHLALSFHKKHGKGWLKTLDLRHLDICNVRVRRQHLFIPKTLILQVRIRHNYGNNYLRYDK